ncbi:MAG: hypothetical protein LUD69_05875 [Oscillospiraceae bacterium]|nr:hypothetical protein [Oscillospiraceae bacterium]
MNKLSLVLNIVYFLIVLAYGIVVFAWTKIEVFIKGDPPVFGLGEDDG